MKFVKTGKFKSPHAGALPVLMKQIAKYISEYIRDYVRTRVVVASEGEGGSSLVGYSTNPVTIDYPGAPKRKKKPVGGTHTHDGMFFYGGYEQYREKAGLVSNRFVFFNTGDAWRDWKVVLYGSGPRSVSQIGFSNDANAMAASAAQVKRPNLFSIDGGELSVVDDYVLAQVNKTFFPA